MRKAINQKLRLGIFVILGTLIFIVAVYLVGSHQNLFSKNINVSASFTNVKGLLIGNNVRYSGVDVGNVKAITLVNDSVISVSLIINKKMTFHIKKNAIATITSDGLVGNMIVNITPGKGNALPIENGDILKSEAKGGTDTILSTLNITADNTQLLTNQLHNILQSVQEGKGTLGMLINDTITANNLKQTISNLNQASIKANKTIDEINGLVNSINLNKSVAGVLLNDTIQATKVKSAITNLEQSTTKINGVITNLNQTLINIKEGEGAINYLSNNKEFVENLEQTIKNLNEGTDKFNQNMEALKHNFLTKGYFKKLEKEEAKKNN